MEDRNNDRHRRGVDVSDDTTIRMKTRPKANKSSTDYESSLASGSKPKKSVRATSISSPKLPKGKSTSETIHVSDGSSEDELLLSDDRDSELVEEEENGELKKIQKMESVMLKKPDFSEKNYSQFKIPRTKTSGGTDNASSSKTLRKENDTASRSARSLDISSYSYKPGTSSLTPLSPKSANTRPNPKSHEVPSSPGKSDKASKPTRLKVFGRPPNTSRLETFNSRTAKSAAASGSSQSNVKNAKGKATKVKQRQIVDSDDDIEVSEVPKKTVPETFPLSPPRNLDESSSKSRSLKKTPEAFPMSPDTPVVSKNKAMSSKSRSRDSDEEDVGSDRGRKPAAFPMLESPGLDISFSTPKAGLSGSKGKRSSSISPDGSGSRRKKKRPHDEPPSSSFSGTENVPALTYDSDEDFEELDSFRADPETLCPYCDAPLPESPSPLLLRLLEQTAAKSVRAPRPRNPLGRKAALGIYVTVCQRHRFESEILPEAGKKGWPKDINWKAIEGRVKNMREDLQALLDNDKPRVYDPAMFEDDDDDDDEEIRLDDDKTVRDFSVFWKEAVKEVKEKGTRVAGNVKNQFANFEKTRPGYYGELGSVIIHQTLFEMFPPQTTNEESDNFAPLNLKSFIERVLVPEVSTKLIMEDKGLEGYSGMKEAVQILRESSSYGVAMFPEDGGEWGGAGAGGAGSGSIGKKRSQRGGGREEHMSVADQMVREKARKRRAELMVEEKVDKALIAEEKGEERKEGKGRGKGKRKDDGAVSATESGSERPQPRPRPRPRPVTKNKGMASFRSDDDMQSGTSDFQSDSELDHGAGADTKFPDAGIESIAAPGSELEPWDHDDMDFDFNSGGFDDLDALLNEIGASSKTSSELFDLPLSNVDSDSRLASDGGKSPMEVSSGDEGTDLFQKNSKKQQRPKPRPKLKSKLTKPETNGRTTSRAASDTDGVGDDAVKRNGASADHDSNMMDISSDSDEDGAVSIRSVRSTRSAMSVSSSTRSTTSSMRAQVSSSTSSQKGAGTSRESSLVVESTRKIDPAPTTSTSSKPRPRPRSKAAAPSSTLVGDDIETTPRASKTRSSRSVEVSISSFSSSVAPLQRARQMLNKPDPSTTKDDKKKKLDKDGPWLKSMRSDVSRGNSSNGKRRYSYAETDEDVDQRMIPAPATSPTKSDSGWLLDDSQESIDDNAGKGVGRLKRGW